MQTPRLRPAKTHRLNRRNLCRISLSLTDTENKALEYAGLGPNSADNALTNRARIAKDEIIEKFVAHCNSNGIAIATGEDAQVTQARTRSRDTAANVQAAAEAAAAAMAASSSSE